MGVDDGCSYDSDDNGSRDANWAMAWQDAHVEGSDWYQCSAAHSEPLNANRKAYAAWWLWASLAGWDQGGSSIPIKPVDSSGTIDSNDQQDQTEAIDGSNVGCFILSLQGFDGYK